MSNVILTTSGASFVSTAGTAGPYFPLKYFLLAYDYRIDHNVLPTSGLTPISGGDFTSAVNMTGDIIYNLDTLSTSSYSMTNNEMLIYNSGQTGTSTISNNPFDSTAYITLRNGVPLSHTISGTSLVYSYPNWTVAGYTIVSGNNSVPTGYSDTARGRFFRTASYAPISSAAGGNSRGLWKIRIGNQVGNFKFNKIGIYAARMLANGTEDTSVDPVLFAIVNLVDPIIKSSDTSNIAYFELDLELEISSNNTFGQYSFLSNTSWNYVAGEQAVHFDGKVAIGTSGIPTSWMPRSKLQITENNPAIPFVRMTNDSSATYVDQYLVNSSNAIEQKFYGSKSEMRITLQSSGTSEFSKISLEADTNNRLRNIDLKYEGSVSGDHHTGFDSTYGGYLEQFDTYVNSQYLSTFRANDLGSYATLVLGNNAPSLYEHPGKFLTVHGGSLLVGSSLVSGSLSGGDLYPNTVYCDGTITSLSTIFAAGGFYTGIFIGTGSGQVIAGRNLSISTSAHFNGPVTLGSTLSGGSNLYGYHLFARGDLVASGEVTSNTNVRAGLGGTGYISTPNLLVSTSAHFVGPVTVQNMISAAGSLYADDFNFVNGGSMGGTLTVDNLTVNTNTFLNGPVTVAGSAPVLIYDNLNVSGLFALDGNMNLDAGDLQIRRKGKSLLANITSVAVAGSSMSRTATYSNGESFGIATGWPNDGNGALRINTSKANSGSLIFAFPYTNTASPTPTGLTIGTISNGSYFEVHRTAWGDSLGVFWFIIGASS